MEVTEIKIELHQKIDSANAGQLKQIYGLINNYLNGDDAEEWNMLTTTQREHVLIGLEQAHAGEGNLLTDINKRLKAKYGING